MVSNSSTSNILEQYYGKSANCLTICSRTGSYVLVGRGRRGSAARIPASVGKYAKTCCFETIRGTVQIDGGEAHWAAFKLVEEISRWAAIDRRSRSRLRPSRGIPTPKNQGQKSDQTCEVFKASAYVKFETRYMQLDICAGYGPP